MKSAARAVFPIVLLVLTVLSTAGGAQDSRGTSVLTIDQAREILGRGASNVTLGTITLGGLNYSREIGLGRGFRVIVLSKNTGGGLLLFSPQGLLQNSVATDEIAWIQLFDLNDDGISELVTEEIEGRGTGILVKNFKLYMVGHDGIKQIWERLSYRRETPWNPGHLEQRGHEIQCFLRFDAANAGSPGHITYMEPLNNTAQFRKTEYVMSGSTIREVSDADAHSGK